MFSNIRRRIRRSAAAEGSRHAARERRDWWCGGSARGGLVLAGRRSTQWNHGNEIRLTVRPMRVPTASAAAAAADAVDAVDAAAGVRSKSSQTASSQCDRLARNR